MSIGMEYFIEVIEFIFIIKDFIIEFTINFIIMLIIKLIVVCFIM